jgi:hypothetical protein
MKPFVRASGANCGFQTIRTLAGDENPLRVSLYSG